jgi:hypothetical protein
MYIIRKMNARRLINTLEVANSINSDRRVVELINVQGTKLPRQDVMDLPIVVSCRRCDANIGPTTIQFQCGREIDGRCYNRRVQIIQIDVQQSKSGSPVTLTAIGEIAILYKAKKKRL